MNRSFCTSAQVENELQTACISIVPSFKGSNEPSPRIVLQSPFSRFAEAIRSIKVTIDLNHSVGCLGKVIGFISSLPNEGKSTIATSLALHIAQVGARVILVDCDLRNPSLSRRLAPGSVFGFLDVISGKTTLEDAIWTDQLTNLAFLPAGVKTPLSNSSELLAADATKSLFGELRSRYDYILVDLPPLIPIVDTRATTGFIDSYVCLIEWRSTRIDAVRHAFNDAQSVYEKLIGVVLNKVDIRRLSSYELGGRSYYSDRHFVQYGELSPNLGDGRDQAAAA
jgi:capsular exopolysaccharide synthesis family protein